MFIQFRGVCQAEFTDSNMIGVEAFNGKQDERGLRESIYFNVCSVMMTPGQKPMRR